MSTPFGIPWALNGRASELTFHKRARTQEYLSGNLSKKQRRPKVTFASDDCLDKVHYFDPWNGHEAPAESVDGTSDEEKRNQASQESFKLTAELSLLSTLHSRARRELRDISKHDFHTAIKYGIKSPGHFRNGEQRWKFEFGNTIFITDESCTKEITCFKKAIKIEPANITDAMMVNHNEAVRVLRDDPHLCTTHSIIIIDQSGSMRNSDVNGFRSRSDAAYGTLAIDYIAEQLYQQGDGFFVDAVTIIEMNDTSSILFHKEPLDWILFNKVLARMKKAKPRSHGNYVNSLAVAEKIVQEECALLYELDAEDIPAFTLVFISDGKPSDNLPGQKDERISTINIIAHRLKSKLTFLGMGIGASDSDFSEMKLLVDIAKLSGAEGSFVHAGLNPACISTTFTSMATSITTTRNDLLSKRDQKGPKTEKSYTMREKKDGKMQVRRELNGVSRYLYDHLNLTYPWRNVSFINNEAVGFEVEKDPFGKGAERLAHMFYEVKRTLRGWERVGKPMVAKESRYIEDEGSKEKFHTSFCRVQHKAKELAIQFNNAVHKAPLLKPSEDEVSTPPPLDFLKCSIYEYTDRNWIECGLLVEKYLNGKFTKYNGNNGYVNNSENEDAASVNLEIGRVKLTDFIQAFSHWVYENSGHNMVVCDLQGILDLEGRRPAFQLTDPAICSRNSRRERYGKTDLGMTGIRQICRHHKCNNVCKGLNLPLMRAK